MPLTPKTKPPLDTPEKRAAAPPRCVFLATEKFCQTWGDLFQPGDLVEIVHSKVVVSRQTVGRSLGLGRKFRLNLSPIGFLLDLGRWAGFRRPSFLAWAW